MTGAEDTWAKRFNAYGALVTTAIILFLLYLHPDDDTLKILASAVVYYWVGSSRSSQNKDEALANSTPLTVKTEKVTEVPAPADAPAGTPPTRTVETTTTPASVVPPPPIPDAPLPTGVENGKKP